MIHNHFLNALQKKANALCLSYSMVFLTLFSCLPPNVCSAALLNEFNIKDEKQLGKKFDILVKTKMPIIHDPVVAQYVESIVISLAEVMPPQPYDLNVNVLLDDSINAFAVPGGSIFVNSGLLLAFETESQLAAVLAHELAHVSLRHIARRIERMQKASLISLAGALASIFIAQDRDAQAAVAVGSMAAAQASMLSYSQEDEREADQVGLNYLVDAGYRPQGLAEGFEIIRRHRWHSGSSAAPSYLSTHPGVGERIGYLEQRVSRLPENVLQRHIDNEPFARMQTILRARYDNVKSALAHFASPKTCLDRLGFGVALNRDDKMDQAGELLREALVCSDEDPLFLREYGRFLYKRGEYDEAAIKLQQTVLQAPDDLMALFYYARILDAKGQKEKAAEYFRKILKTLPEDSEVHYFLGRSLGENNDYFTAHLHLAYSALYNNNKSRTLFHMKKARELAATSEQRQLHGDLESEYKERSEFWKQEM